MNLMQIFIVIFFFTNLDKEEGRSNPYLPHCYLLSTLCSILLYETYENDIMLSNEFVLQIKFLNMALLFLVLKLLVQIFRNVDAYYGIIWQREGVTSGSQRVMARIMGRDVDLDALVWP